MPDKATQIRSALADPNAPWYGSDLVPLVADYLDEAEKAMELFAYIDEHEVSDGLIAKRLEWANEAEKVLGGFVESHDRFAKVCNFEQCGCDMCRSSRPLLTNTVAEHSAPTAQADLHCCFACERAAIDAGKLSPFGRRFIVCPKCGNKRCPKASHHDNDCTGSNKPGQPGSIFATQAAGEGK